MSIDVSPKHRPPRILVEMFLCRNSTTMWLFGFGRCTGIASIRLDMTSASRSLHEALVSHEACPTYMTKK